jgi:hypothetical protein
MADQELVYVGLNGRVAALDRDTGEIAWEWRASNGKAYPAMLVDGDRLLVSMDGYTYALDAYTGEQLWYNPLQGYGVGPPSLASCRSQALHGNAANAAAVKRATEQSNFVPPVT